MITKIEGSTITSICPKCGAGRVITYHELIG